MTETDTRMEIEEALRRRVARGEERGLNTITDFKAAAEKTLRAERRHNPARRSYRQHDPIPRPRLT